jgi:hypothetical protein
MASNQTEQKALKGKRGKNDQISVRFTDPGYTEQIAAGKPQAVVKVISQARGFRAQKVMEYIDRAEGNEGEQSLEFEDAKGEIQKGREQASAMDCLAATRLRFGMPPHKQNRCNTPRSARSHVGSTAGRSLQVKSLNPRPS